MKEFDFVVKSPVGIHARPAMLLTKEAKKYQSKITIICNDKRANIKNMVELLMLGVSKESHVTILIEGEDEDIAAKQLEEFCKKNI